MSIIGFVFFFPLWSCYIYYEAQNNIFFGFLLCVTCNIMTLVAKVLSYRLAHENPARRLVDQRGRRSRTLYRKLTLRLLMSYIYGAPSKARNTNVVYIWTYVWQR